MVNVSRTLDIKVSFFGGVIVVVCHGRIPGVAKLQCQTCFRFSWLHHTAKKLMKVRLTHCAARNNERYRPETPIPETSGAAAIFGTSHRQTPAL